MMRLARTATRSIHALYSRARHSAMCRDICAFISMAGFIAAIAIWLPVIAG